MQPFSSKEYEFLKKETTEIRNCITNYIGFIITATGFTGFIRYIIGSQEIPTLILFIITVTMIIVTALFEIIYYKFKSHNRFVGYIHLLMQEQGIIKLTKKIKNDKNKNYIKNYKELMIKRSKYKKLFGEIQIYSWEFIMSRYNNNTYRRNSQNDIQQVLKNTLSATSKNKFVFSIPDMYSNEIEVNDYDKHFFKRIVLKLYPFQKQKIKLLKKLSLLVFSIKYLFTNKEVKKDVKGIFIDKTYVSSGWLYPKKITQIGFISIILFYIYFIFELLLNFDMIPLNVLISKIRSGQIIHEFSDVNMLPVFFLFFVTTIFLFWINRYVYNLKELIYGRFSIDYYCWNFFIFRAHFLNESKILPVYYSRSFIRFFKTVLITRFVVEYGNNDNTYYETLIKKLYKCKTKDEIIQLLKKNNIATTEGICKLLNNEKVLKEHLFEVDIIVDEIIKSLIIKSKIFEKNRFHPDFVTEPLLEEYADKLIKFQEFENDERTNIHNVIVKIYKKKKNFNNLSS